MYHLLRFGSVVFPTTMPIVQMPTAPPLTGTVKTTAGGFDAWGTETAPPEFPVRVQYRVTVTGAAAAMLAKVDELRGIGRQRLTLSRTFDGVDIQSAPARLIDVNSTSTVQTKRAIEMTLNFEVWDFWRANSNVGWVLDDGSTLDGGLVLDAVPLTTTLSSNPQALSITNGGNVAVDDAIVTITAGSTAITSLTIECRNAKWTWTGTLAAGKVLRVDAGRWMVTNDGVDAYAGFAFTPIHTLSGILQLLPGSNTLTVSRVGGSSNSTINVAFSEAWA